MPYASYEEVITRYSILKTWGKSITEVSSDLIYFAEMELNGRMATHFTVPFSASHPTIKDLTIELSYYRALAQTDPKKAKKIHERILGRIQHIKEGHEYIYTGSGTVITPDNPSQDIWSTMQAYAPVHSMLGAESPYTAVDSNLLQAEKNART